MTDHGGRVEHESEGALADPVSDRMVADALPGAMIKGKTIVATSNAGGKFLVIFADGSGIEFGSLYSLQYIERVGHVPREDENVIDGEAVDADEEELKSSGRSLMSGDAG